MFEAPRKLVDVISVTPAMRPNCRSSGVATDVAIVSGLAPGKFAWTEIVGKSTCGSDDTGRSGEASPPARNRPIVRSVVATGRRMKGEEKLMPAPDPAHAASAGAGSGARGCRRPGR